METSKLKVFLAIAKTESIRGAAEIANLTPSAVSKIFHQLQDELGVQLLVPVGRGLKLTPEGRHFSEESERIIDELERLKKTVAGMSERKRESPIVLATFEVFSTYFLQVLESQKGMDKKIVLHETLPGSLEQAVACGKADFGITYIPVAFPEVEHLKISRIEMGTFRKRGSFERLPPEDLPYVVPVMPLQGAPTRHQGLDGWPNRAFTRKVAHEVTLMESALELCRQGLCGGYFPTFIIQLHNRRYRPEYSLVRHSTPKPGTACHTDVYLVKRKNEPENRNSKFVGGLVRMGTRVAPGFTGS